MERIRDVEVVVRARGTPAEGPIWDPQEGVLYWVDIRGQVVHVYDPKRDSDRAVPLDLPVGALAPRTSGGLVAAVRDGFASLDLDGHLTPIHTLPASDPPVRMNDGKCDGAGRFWAGTMGLQAEPGAGALYRLDPDLTVRKMLDSVTISNGLCWSLDETTMYYIDSFAFGVDAFDFSPEQGAISNRRRLIDIPREDGVPDGMTIDAEGNLWVAIFGGWSVRNYAPDGTLEATVELPVSQVTSCTFGGYDLGDLYITSAATRLNEEQLREQPYAGSLFRCRPGVEGLSPAFFAG